MMNMAIEASMHVFIILALQSKHDPVNTPNLQINTILGIVSVNDVRIFHERSEHVASDEWI